MARRTPKPYTPKRGPYAGQTFRSRYAYDDQILAPSQGYGSYHERQEHRTEARRAGVDPASMSKRLAAAGHQGAEYRAVEAAILSTKGRRGREQADFYVADILLDYPGQVDVIIGTATVRAVVDNIVAKAHVDSGTIYRQANVRIMRVGEEIHIDQVERLTIGGKRVQEAEAGATVHVLLRGFAAFQVGDIIEVFTSHDITDEIWPDSP